MNTDGAASVSQRSSDVLHQQHEVQAHRSGCPRTRGRGDGRSRRPRPTRRAPAGHDSRCRRTARAAGRRRPAAVPRRDRDPRDRTSTPSRASSAMGCGYRPAPLRKPRRRGSWCPAGPCTSRSRRRPPGLSTSVTTKTRVVPVATDCRAWRRSQSVCSRDRHSNADTSWSPASGTGAEVAAGHSGERRRALHQPAQPRQVACAAGVDRVPRCECVVVELEPVASRRVRAAPPRRREPTTNSVRSVAVTEAARSISSRSSGGRAQLEPAAPSTSLGSGHHGSSLVVRPVYGQCASRSKLHRRVIDQHDALAANRSPSWAPTRSSRSSAITATR